MVYNLRPRKTPANAPKSVPQRKGQGIRKKQKGKSPIPNLENLGEPSRTIPQTRTITDASTQTLLTTPAPNCSSSSFPIGQHIRMDIRASWYPKNPHEEGSGEKIDAGDDAFFVAWAQKGVSIMIADGVGGARSVSGDEITPFLCVIRTGS